MRLDAEGRRIAFRRWLARQFAHPSGPAGQWLVGPWLDRIDRPMNRLALQSLAPEPGEHILEIGFGGGSLLARLRRAGAHPAGVDISAAMVRRAVRRGFDALQGSAASLPLADRRFDKAVSVNSLYFWPDLGAAAAELARVLRPGGKLVLCFQAPEAVRAWPGHVFGFHAYGVADVTAAIKGAGFGDPAIASGRDHRLGRFFCMTSELA